MAITYTGSNAGEMQKKVEGLLGPSKLKQGIGSGLGAIAQSLGGQQQEEPMPQMEMLPNQGIMPKPQLFKAGNDMGQAVLL
jgi:hypothetical protein